MLNSPVCPGGRGVGVSIDWWIRDDLQLRDKAKSTQKRTQKVAWFNEFENKNFAALILKLRRFYMVSWPELLVASGYRLRYFHGQNS